MLAQQVVWFWGVVVVLDTLVQPSVSTFESDVEIVGGGEAKLNEYPFAVYTTSESGRHSCTGSLVDRRWVLTAAHCLGAASYVVLGDYSRPGNDTTKQVIAIEEEVQHPGWNYSASGRLDHDIGLIKLANPADIRSEAVAKIPVQKSKAYNKKMMAGQKNCRLVGWGVTKEDGAIFLTQKLLKQRMRIVNETESVIRGNTPYQYEGMMAVEAIYKDACKVGGGCFGDSGGPLVCKKNGKWVQGGVHSFSFAPDGCITGIKGQANVYEHYTWIQSIINP